MTKGDQHTDQSPLAHTLNASLENIQTTTNARMHEYANSIGAYRSASQDWSYGINTTTKKKKKFKKKRNSLAAYGSGTSIRIHQTMKPSLGSNFNFCMSEKKSSLREMSQDYEGKKSIRDGTSERELLRAMGTWLNCTAPDNYKLPNLTGNNFQTVMSEKKNQPSFTMRARDKKMPWYPNMMVDFVGKDAPPVTKYSE